MTPRETTGKYDRKGQEIFEGDLVLNYNTSPRIKDPTTGRIAWSDRYKGMWVIKDDEGEVALADPSGKYGVEVLTS